MFNRIVQHCQRAYFFHNKIWLLSPEKLSDLYDTFVMEISLDREVSVAFRHRLSSYGRRAFSVAGPVIWNWLPDSLRDAAISRDSFKRSLKTFLFSAYSCT